VRSSDSTGTRDIYHGNKIQFSRTEGTVLLHFAGRRFLRLALVRRRGGAFYQVRFRCQLFFSLTPFFLSDSASSLCVSSFEGLGLSGVLFIRPAFETRSFLLRPFLVGAAVWRSVPKGRRKLRPTPHLVKVFCLVGFVF
jgi:hypothetical protein